MSGLGPDARALIDAASEGDDPSSADAARVRAKVAARVAIAAGTGAAGVTAAKTSAAATTAGIGTKIALAVAVVGATSAGGAALYERATREPIPVIETAPTLATPVPSSPARALAPAPAPDPTPAPAPAPAPPPARTVARSVPIATSTKPTTTTDTLAEEARLLRAAHASLAAGDGRGAMTALDEHASRFPRGALSEEREAGRVLALCAQGRAVEARAAASAFVATSPRSPLAAQVRRSCATTGE